MKIRTLAIATLSAAVLATGWQSLSGPVQAQAQKPGNDFPQKQISFGSIALSGAFPPLEGSDSTSFSKPCSIMLSTRLLIRS